MPLGQQQQQQIIYHCLLNVTKMQTKLKSNANPAA